MHVSGRVRRTARIVVSLLAVLVAVGLLGIAGYVWACGTERWLVKVGDDVDAILVDTFDLTSTSVSEMNTFPRPSTIPATRRHDWVEETAFQVYATLLQYRRDPDGDYHLVLVDDDGSTMVAEIPDPICVSTGSPFYDYIANTRATFDSTFTVTTTWHYPDVPVLVTGVGFWDRDHGQTGRALNIVELHPVLDIQFP